jgi:hypothetical protein
MFEPVRLGDILPEVYVDIERRCERNANNLDFMPRQSEHRDRVFAATRDFLTGRKKKTWANRQRQMAAQKVLF